MSSKKTKTSSRTVVVFGGSGYLGSHVCDVLTDAGFNVRIFDLRTSPYLRKGQSMILGDILDREKVMSAVRGCKFVYNLAGLANLDDASTKPLQTIRLNVEGNVNILDACVALKVEHYVYASTIYVYSEKGGFYRCSKQASELYIEEYQRRFGLDFTILRYGTLYGPRADMRNSVYRYLHSALMERRISCQGTGEEIRDYIHVRDAARLSVDILIPRYKNQHIIISGHHPIRFQDMVRMIQEILGKKIEVQYLKAQGSAHYNYTPYSFIPKIGNKLTGQLYVDMGQGFLECLYEMSPDLKK
jgi:UDP-glucose 4-epimerase